MWRELTFAVPAGGFAARRMFPGDQQPNSREWRKLLASMNGRYGMGLPPEFFGANGFQEDGSPLVGGASEARYVLRRTAGGVAIVALGASACAMLGQKAGLIHACLIRDCETMVPMTDRQGEHRISLSPWAKGYYIHELALGKGGYGKWQQMAKDLQGRGWTEGAGKEVALALYSSLQRQCVFLLNEGDEIDDEDGLPQLAVGSLLQTALSGEASWSQIGARFMSALDVQVRSIGRHTFVPWGPCSKHHLVLRGVEFTMRASIDGPLFLGRMRIEGKGMVVPATGSWIHSIGSAGDVAVAQIEGST